MARARVLAGVFAWRSFGDFPDGKTLRVFRDADSFFSASQISTRGPPRKPHEMAQQVPAAVIPAGLEVEKREKLKSVYQAMTNKEMNTPQVCYHVLLAFEWNSEAATEYLNGTPQQRSLVRRTFPAFISP